jgi:hypothetical protein
MKAFTTVFCIISIALIVLFSMPCYAQIETQGIFFPDNTAWYIDNDISPMIPDPHLVFQSGKLFLCGSDITYSCRESEDDPFGNPLYQNRLISKFAGLFSIYNSPGPEQTYYTLFGYVIPCLGIGRVKYCIASYWPPITSNCFESKLDRDYFYYDPY